MLFFMSLIKTHFRRKCLILLFDPKTFYEVAKMKKKLNGLICLILACVITAICFTGCASVSADSGEKKDARRPKKPPIISATI